MDELIARLEKFEGRFSRWHKDTVVAGNIPSPSSTILETLVAARDIMRAPLRREGDNRFRLCDLGAGLGRVVALAAASGMWSYGFEINKKVAKGAKKNLERNNEALEFRGVVFHGSFYSSQYMAFRESGESVSARYEKNDPVVKQIIEYANFAPLAEPSFSNIQNYYQNTDIFYLYPWSAMIPSGIELFSFHASPGATLIVNTFEPPYLPAYAKDLNLEHIRVGKHAQQFHLLRQK